MSEVKKDNLACGAVLATMLLTIVCGAFVVQVDAADSPQAVQPRPENRQ